MIRWGTLMAGCWFHYGTGSGLVWAKRNAHLPARCLSPCLGLIGQWWMRLWLTSWPPPMEHAELEAIASQNAERRGGAGARSIQSGGTILKDL